jgi:hypothetical protein
MSALVSLSGSYITTHIKVKFPLYLIKHHTMKTYGGVEV